MSLKVLLADDSMTAQNMAKKILADSGYEVTTVSNGAAAVKKIAEVKPDLVILDIYMPGYTGLEVCERVRANLETSKLPVLLTVGKMEPYRPEDGARVRADGIIVKPFEATDLLGIVKKISEKLTPAPKPAPVEVAPAVEESEPEPEEQKPASRMEVPAEIAVAPAMEFEELSVAEPAPAAFQWAAPAEVADAVPHGFVPPSIDLPAVAAVTEPGTVTDSIPVYMEPEMTADVVAEFEPTMTPAVVSPEVAPLPEIEFTSAPHVEVPVEAAAELESFEMPEAAAPSEQDPALVTDPSDIAQFATGFGVKNAEEVPVGTVTGNEPFFAEPSETPELLNAAEVFGAPAQSAEVEEETPAVVEEPEAVVMPEPEPAAVVQEPAAARQPDSVDDFEARVAAAMSAFDQPLENGALSVEAEPVVEQVDTFVGDPEIVNPISVESEALEPEPVVEPEPVQLAPTPEPETHPALDVDETMVLPAEALLSLEAEMRKAMELKNTAEPQEISVSISHEPAHFTTEPEAPAGHHDEVMIEPSAPEPSVAPALAMAAAAAAAPSLETWDGFGEEKLASAVQVAVERLKPQLIAEIVRALKGND